MRGPGGPHQDSPYRGQGGGSGPSLTLYYLPQFRIYFAPIVAVLAYLMVSGVTSPDYWRNTYRHAVSCETNVSPRTFAVTFAHCEDESFRPFPCEEAKARLASLLHPGLRRGDVRVYLGRSDEPVSFEKAKAALEACLPTAPPRGYPSSYEGGDHHRATLTVVANDYTFSAGLSLLSLLALLAFLPSRLVRIRLEAATKTLRVRDDALWRSARAVDCLLGDVADTQIIDSRLAFVTRAGARLLLTETDRRPVELQARTLARIRGWLASMREL